MEIGEPLAEKMSNLLGHVHHQSIASWSNGDPMEEKMSKRGEHFMGGIAPDHLRCCARAKGSGERCRKYRRPGRKVCYLHGGKSLGGFVHPQYVHGFASKQVCDLFKQWQRQEEIADERFDFLMNYNLTNLLLELIEADPVIRANGLAVIKQLWHELAHIRMAISDNHTLSESCFDGLLKLVGSEVLLEETAVMPICPLPW